MEANDKKLKGSELILGGFALLITVLMWTFSRFLMIELYDLNVNGISTEAEIIAFHDKISSSNIWTLTATGMTWISLPIALIHVHIMNRLYRQLFPRYHLLRFLYTKGWIIMTFVICILSTINIIVNDEFNWEFTLDEGSSTQIYTGYYIQLYLITYIISITDSIMICSAMTSIIPWLILLFIFINISQPKSELIGTQFKELLCPFNCRNNVTISILLISWILIIIASSIIDTFDWNKSNQFFSLFGTSQYIGFTIFLSYIMISIWMIWLSNKIDDIYTKYEYQPINDDDNDLYYQLL